MLTVKRYFASLAVLLVACGTYALAVAPWIAPPAVRPRAPGGSVGPTTAPLSVEADLERLFPPGAWQRDQPKVIETEHCTLLIQDYRTTKDGGLELKPCTLVFYAAAGDASGAAARRPIVLDAPGGATLEFDQPLDLPRAEFGRLTRGELSGPITIFSPATKADGSDALLLRTRDVRLELDQNRVYTNHEVDFRYGESFGRGRDLEILLLPKQQPARAGDKAPPLGGVQSLQLARIERLQIAMAGEGLGSLLGGDAKAAADAPSAPLEVSCRGPFVFDVVQQAASFEDQVEVVRAAPGLPVDRLRCERLVLEFLMRGEDGAAAGTPLQAADDPLGGRLARIVAEGAPATLDAPTSGVRASAARMEISLAKRRIALKPDEPLPPGQVVRRPRVERVSLEQHEQHFVARELQYEMAEPGRLGRLIAAGPGELRLLQDREATRQFVTARWQDRLDIRPDGRNQVISLVGSANITLEPLARFDAKELHVWVLEVPQQDAVPAAAASETPGGKKRKPKYTILPDRLLATGSVMLRSPQLDVDTARLEAWFIHRPPQQPPAGPTTPVDSAPQVSQPVSAAAHLTPTTTQPPSIRPPQLQKFRADGGVIQLQLVVQGREFDLEDLTIRNHARIEETQTQEPGQEPIKITGELLELRQGTTPQATVEVTGLPAELAGRGLALVGNKINVHRGENRLWIDGPGEATLPIPAGQSLALTPGAYEPPPQLVREPASLPKGSAAPPQKLHVVWQRGLTFDGRTAHLAGEVQARTKDQVALAQTLDLTLTERIDFGAAAKGQQPELARLHLGGGVFIESRGYDQAGQKASHEQVQVPSLSFDRAAGTLHAPGPGWVSTVRRLERKLPGIPIAGASSTGGPFGSAKDKPLTSVHIAYERQIVGNLARREVQFQDRVRTTYSPAREFTELIKAERLADLGEQSVLMTSDRLTMTEMIVGPQKWMEMEASGNVVVEGQRFAVQAVRVRYTSDKELLTIEGDARNDARLEYEAVPGQPRGRAAAVRFKYWIREETFEGEGFSFLGSDWTGGKLKLPGMRR